MLSALPETTRVLRLLFAAWVAFVLVGTLMSGLLLAPALRFDAMPVERADFVAAAGVRVGFGAWLFAARGLGELLAAAGLLLFARQLPFQPGAIAATFAVCASSAALVVDASGAHLYASSMPDAARAAADSAGALNVPDFGEGLLGALANVLEELVGYGRGQAMRDFVRIEALSMHRVGVFGALLHLAATIALYASVASMPAPGRTSSLTGSALLTVVGYAIAAGAFYAAISGPYLSSPRLRVGFAGFALVSVSTMWFASAVGQRVGKAREALRAPGRPQESSEPEEPSGEPSEPEEPQEPPTRP